MGGYGSGSWVRWNTKVLVTSCLSLDVLRLHQEGLLRSWGLPSSSVYECSWQKDSGGPQSSIGIQVGRDQLTLRYRYHVDGAEWQVISESVPLSWTPCKYGGRRPWFLCPGVSNGISCSRRVAKLYMRGRYFRCRPCHGLVYPSQNVAVADRPMTRAQNIRMRLGGSANLLEPFPGKPKGMHWGTYWRFRDKALKAEMGGLANLQAQLDRLKS